MSRSDWCRDRRGVAAVEFALAVPLLLLLLLVTADVVLWMRARMRVEQAASQTALIFAQYSVLYEGDFAATFYPVAQAAVAGAPLACPGGSMVVTGFDSTPAVKWRWTSAPSDGSCTATLAVAGSGPAIAKPAVLGAYVPPATLSVLAVELATPWSGRVITRDFLRLLERLYGASLAGLDGPFTIRAHAVAVPRVGNLPLVKLGSRPP